MNFFDYDFNIDKIVFACKVLAGTGNTVHNNRPSHGLCFNIGGEKRYVFDNKKTLTVKENDVIFLPEKSYYTVKDVVSGDCCAVNFKINENISFEPFVLHIKNNEKMLTLFSDCEKNFKKKKNGYIYKCKSELYEIIYELTKEYNFGYSSGREFKILSPSIDYIHNFYSEKSINIDFLAKLCGIKEAYFRRMFTKCYGISPISYINRLKLTRAKELLFQTEYSLEKVCEISGFNNESYFCRFFKKSVGMTPTQYKKKKIF